MRIEVTPAKPWRWSAVTRGQRAVLIAAALGWMLDSFDVMLYALVLADLMRHFGMRAATAGLLNTLTLSASALGSLLFGFWADRYGRRRMLECSILTYSVFTFLCGLAPSLLWLGVFRFALGLGMGGEWNTGVALVAESWPDAWRGRALGIVQSSWAVGYALAAAAAGLALPRWGWRGVFFLGVLPALAVFWIRRHAPESEAWRKARSGRTSTQAAAPGASQPAPRHPEKLSRKALALLLAMNTFGMFAWWGLFTWIPAFLELPASRGGRGFFPGTMILLMLALNLGGMLPGYLSFGWFADRIGRKKTLVTYLLLAAALAPAFAWAHGPGALLAAGIPLAFFGTGFFTGSAIVGSELFPTAVRATALGATYNVARGLSALAPLIIGSWAGSRGLGTALAACGVAYLLAAGCVLPLPETKGKQLMAAS